MSQLFIPSSPNSNGDQRNLSFMASTVNVAHLAESLSALTSVSSHALMIFSESGITVYSEYNHILNVQLTIDASLFSSYSLSDLTQASQDAELRLGIDIQLVSDALTAAASTALPKPKTAAGAADAVVCYIKYMGEGHPLVIEFEDRLMSELIEFSTFYYEYEYPYDAAAHVTSELLVNHDRIQLEVILKSDLLANLILDLILLNTQELFLYASTTGNNQLNFISKGSIGYLKLTYPNGKTMLEKMEIHEQREDMELVPGSVLSSFNFASFVRIFRAVRMSTRCKMMKDMSGVFSVQLLCKNLGISGYPGTLITFNMLERADEADTDVNALFDDELYQHEKQNLEASTTEPFSYASFKVVRPEAQELRPDDREDFVGGAVEVPLFL